MVDFRRVITVLGILVLFVGIAAAQSPLTCNVNVTNVPQLRGEGYTEQTGDILISCTGGSPLANGAQIPLINITIYYNTTVTSRLLPTTAPQASSATSEALLFIDDPGTTPSTPTYGSQLGQLLCTTPLTGCMANAGYTPSATAFGVIGTVPVVPGTTQYAPNVYQGVVANNYVTFYGVPAMAPGTQGSRYYRITNVRVNAQPLAGGSASGATPVQASIATSNNSLPISNSVPNVGWVTASLSASAAGTGNLMQCVSQSKASVTQLTFTELFATAFKTRVNTGVNTGLYAGQANNPAQNVPGTLYNSESNLVFPINGSQVAGLADFGTRLKATFNNIPSGARVFVSTVNVNNSVSAVSTANPPVPPLGGNAGGALGNANNPTGYTGLAMMVNGETTSDGNAAGGFFPAVVSTDTATAGNVPIAEVTISGGTGNAAWEVINTNPNTIESFKFAVYVSYTANVAANSPLPGTSTVNLSYAPTATSGAASASLPIPRFAGDTSAARNIFSIGICRTILLYPYITNQAGFDTGLTVANTSQDPYTLAPNVTGAQAGNCRFTWYGGTTAAPTTPPAAYDTGSIAAGTVWANTVGTIAPNFQGYAFAVCNFQYAHGFAFISDVGARNLAMGYLAVVMNDPGSASRSGYNSNTTNTENGGH